jgi:hypothetical protein
MPVLATWSLGVDDDGAHALLAARRTLGGHGEVALFEVEDGRAPLEVHRADGEPFTEIESAVRVGGRWYIATPPATEWTSTIWQLDGNVARELARIPRAGMDGRPTGARLARRSDGRAIGYVVDGQPSPDRPGTQRWVLPIDLESGSAGDLEPLGATDLADRSAIPFCGEDDTGWVMDTGWNLGTRLYAGHTYAGSLNSVQARVRVGETRACFERLVGTMGALGAEQQALLTRSGPVRPSPSLTTRLGRTATSAIPVVAVSALSRANQMRYSLVCSRR